MATRSVTILGGGNTAFAVAAKLTLQGHEITLYELPEFASTLEPIRETQTINLAGVAGQGAARIHRVTTDIEEALAASDLALLIVPAYAHKPFAEVCAPHLKAGQTVIIMPGTLGAFEWLRILREVGTTGVTLAEVDTAPYVCRKTAPDTATIWGVVTGLGFGVFARQGHDASAGDAGAPVPRHDSVPRCDGVRPIGHKPCRASGGRCL